MAKAEGGAAVTQVTRAGAAESSGIRGVVGSKKFDAEDGAITGCRGSSRNGGWPFVSSYVEFCCGWRGRVNGAGQGSCAVLEREVSLMWARD